MNPIWLVRMAQWARNPPPMWKVILVLVVVAMCFVLFGIERFWGWPEWLKVNGNTKLR